MLFACVIAYAMGASSFVALVAYLLGEGAGRDARIVVWHAAIMYFVLTIPILYTLTRAGIETAIGRTHQIRWAFAIGVGPCALLAVGRLLRIRLMPAEGSLFLASLGTLVLCLAAGAHIGRIVESSEPPPAGSAWARRLKWLVSILSILTAVFVTIPFSPIHYVPTSVLPIVVATLAIVACIALLLLVDATRRHRRFGTETAAVWLSTYAAVGPVYRFIVHLS